MRVSRDLASLPGVDEAAVMMGTPQNCLVLKEAGLWTDAVFPTPSDLVVAVRGEQTAVKDALAQVDALLAAAEVPSPAVGSSNERAASAPYPALSELAQPHDRPHIAVISVPGVYAAAEAQKALNLGMHVMLFSDNVSIDEEVALKRFAAAHGLIVMGPDCGTALIAQTPLGFVNALRPGPVGLIGASGTGLQLVSVLLDRWDIGVSHLIGTGSRDLHRAVGGLTTLSAIDLLDQDPATQVITVVAKPSDPEVIDRVFQRLNESAKPAVYCDLGPEPMRTPAARVQVVRSLREAAIASAQKVQANFCYQPATGGWPFADSVEAEGWIRGVFQGGTLAYDALVWLKARDPEHTVDTVVPDDTAYRRGHTVMDSGDDRFTQGRPHPMLDPRRFGEMLAREAFKPHTAGIIFDLVLGYGAHPDPAQALAPSLERIRSSVPVRIPIACVLVGTDRDPQDRRRQTQQLETFGIAVYDTVSDALEDLYAVIQRVRR
jgi:succinyl-CoA synthetase alpha subunit